MPADRELLINRDFPVTGNFKETGISFKPGNSGPFYKSLAQKPTFLSILTGISRFTGISRSTGKSRLTGISRLTGKSRFNRFSRFKTSRLTGKIPVNHELRRPPISRLKSRFSSILNRDRDREPKNPPGREKPGPGRDPGRSLKNPQSRPILFSNKTRATKQYFKMD